MHSEYPFKESYQGFLLNGRIDCLAQTKLEHLILDFKFEEREIKQYDANIDKYLQLIFYYYGIKNRFTFKNILLGHYFFLSGDMQTIKPDLQLFQQGWNRISQLYNEIHTISSFDPKANYFCDTCNVRKNGKCPLWKLEDGYAY